MQFLIDALSAKAVLKSRQLKIATNQNKYSLLEFEKYLHKIFSMNLPHVVRVYLGLTKLGIVWNGGCKSPAVQLCCLEVGCERASNFRRKMLACRVNFSDGGRITRTKS